MRLSSVPPFFDTSARAQMNHAICSASFLLGAAPVAAVLASEYYPFAVSHSAAAFVCFLTNVAHMLCLPVAGVLFRGRLFVVFAAVASEPFP